MSPKTSGTSNVIDGEFKRLHDQAEAIDAERDQVENPQPQPEAPPPGVEDLDEGESALATGVMLCKLLAATVHQVWPVLSYTDEQMNAGGQVLAPLIKKYSPAELGFLGRWGDEITAALFFAGIIAQSVETVRAHKPTRPTDEQKTQGRKGQADSAQQTEEPTATDTVYQEEGARA
jgi:hypothetical protein